MAIIIHRNRRCEGAIHKPLPTCMPSFIDCHYAFPRLLNNSLDIRRFGSGFNSISLYLRFFIQESLFSSIISASMIAGLPTEIFLEIFIYLDYGSIENLSWTQRRCMRIVQRYYPEALEPRTHLLQIAISPSTTPGVTNLCIWKGNWVLTIFCDIEVHQFNGIYYFKEKLPHLCLFWNIVTNQIQPYFVWMIITEFSNSKSWFIIWSIIRSFRRKNILRNIQSIKWRPILRDSTHESLTKSAIENFDNFTEATTNFVSS